MPKRGLIKWISSFSAKNYRGDTEPKFTIIALLSMLANSGQFPLGLLLKQFLTASTNKSVIDYKSVYDNISYSEVSSYLANWARGRPIPVSGDIDDGVWRSLLMKVGPYSRAAVWNWGDKITKIHTKVSFDFNSDIEKYTESLVRD